MSFISVSCQALMGNVPPVNLDAVHVLAEEALAASFLGRKAVAKTLFGRAASLARELCGPSLVDAFLTTWHVSATLLVSQLAGTTPVDALKRRVEASTLVKPLIAYLEDREREHTLKPGKCRAEEVTFYAWWLKAKGLANGWPPMLPALLVDTAPCIGYACVMSTGRFALNRAYISTGVTAEGRARAAMFVLSALDLMLDVWLERLGALPEEKCFIGDVKMACAIQRDGYRKMLLAR